MAKIYILLLNIILLLSLSCTSVFAQEIVWQKTIGGSGEEKLSDIHQTSDGGYVLGGYSYSNISGDKTENSQGNRDYWILKIDANANIVWQNTIGGTNDDVLTSIEETLDKGFILGGYSSSDSTGDKSETWMGYIDYWIIKLDSMGSIQWQNTIGGSNHDVLFSAQQTTDGGYFLGGYSISPISGDKTEDSLNNDIWVLKVDSVGVIQWQNTIGCGMHDLLQSVIQTNDGGYLLGGMSNSDSCDNKSEDSKGSYDYWIVKIDSVGILQWQNTIGAYRNDYLYSICKTLDGGYVLGGVSDSGIDNDKTERNISPWPSYSDDWWIVKIDSVGNIQWQNVIGTRSSEQFSEIKQTADGGYIAGGIVSGWISVDNGESKIGQRDYWVVKLDSVGQIVWENLIGGDQFDDLATLEQTADGDYIIGGSSNSSIYADKTEGCIGDYDFWIMKVTDRYNKISGKLYLDANGNSAQDSMEIPLPGLKITEQSTGRFAYSDKFGNYTIMVRDIGNYNTSTPSLLLYTPFPTVNVSFFNSILQVDSLNDFAFQPSGSVDDVYVTITALESIHSGFNSYYEINYGNHGVNSVTPTVVFYPDSNFSYQASTVQPDLVSNDSLLWNLPSLAPFQSGRIIVTVYTNTNLPLGTMISSSVHIDPTQSDAYPANNTSINNSMTTGWFNPNDINVSEDTLTPTQLSNGVWLEYLIRFQNATNTPVSSVRILNPIDTNKLDISTLELMDYSHQVDLSWINYQKNLQFLFNDIYLPNSNIDIPLSHGFVKYRIRPKASVSVGDSISNYAAIFMGPLDPITTNSTKTYILLPTGFSSAYPLPNKLHVFPNPTENTLNITGIHLENGKAQLRLTDIYGKLILEKTITSITTTLETNQLSSGIYLVQSGELRATFVKQ